VLAAVALCISDAAFCQPGAPMPAFDVASVKANRSTQRGSGIDTEPGKVTIRNVSLKLIIQAAYGVKGYQISGFGWLESKGTTLLPKLGRQSGKTISSCPCFSRCWPERFKLALHRETRDLPAWMLVPGSKGPKLHASKDEGCSKSSARDEQSEQRAACPWSSWPTT